MEVEICNECGKSVKPGSGFFVNRTPDLNDNKTRIVMGKPFPEGNFICIPCDNKRAALKTTTKKPKSYESTF